MPVLGSSRSRRATSTGTSSPDPGVPAPGGPGARRSRDVTGSPLPRVSGRADGPRRGRGHVPRARPPASGLLRRPHTHLALMCAVGAAALSAMAPAARAGTEAHFTPGAPGIGDPYFPLEGNGGFDTRHYDLSFSYDPAGDRLEGLAVITAKATQNLSRFDLDLQQLDVSSVTVGPQRAEFARDGQELQITPKQPIPDGRTFTVAIHYGGVPQTIVGSPVVFGSPYGFLHTDDGAFMGDEPNAASTWFPVSDHPADKATYTFRVTVP